MSKVKSQEKTCKNQEKNVEKSINIDKIEVINDNKCELLKNNDNIISISADEAVTLAVAPISRTRQFENMTMPLKALFTPPEETIVREEKEGPCFLQGPLKLDIKSSPDVYDTTPKGKKTKRNGRRIIPNKGQQVLMSFDMDAGMTWKEGVKVVKDSGYQAVMYTSYSHTEDKHKFRIVFVLSEPFQFNGKEDVKRWKALYLRVGEQLGLKFDKACKDVVRVFFLPSCHEDNKGAAKFKPMDGKKLDLSDFEIKTDAILKSHSSGDAMYGDFNVSHQLEQFPLVKLDSMLTDKKYDLLDYDSDRADGGHYMECPYGDEHNNGNPNGAFVVDEWEGVAKISCSHETCKNRYTEHFILKLLEDGIITVKELADPKYLGGVVEELPKPFYYKDNEIWRVEYDPRADKMQRHAVCSYMRFLSLVRSKEGTGWSLEIEVENADGDINTAVIPHRDLHDKRVWLPVLREAGLRLKHPLEANKVEWLLGIVEPSLRKRLIDKTGWHGNVFALPDNGGITCYGAKENEEQYVLEGHIKVDPKFAAAGTLEEWQEHIGKPSQGNSRLVFALSTAFAPVLMDKFNVEGGIFHYKGDSSIGKTVALQVNGSVWGGPEYISDWNTTGNAIENTFVQHNNGSLCMDEFGVALADDVGKITYISANGKGKARMKSDSSSQKQKEWATLISSTGEVTLEEKLKDSRSAKRVTGGQASRFKTLPADTGSGFGLFDDVKGSATSASKKEQGAAFAEAFKGNCKMYYGTPIRAFLEHVTAIENKEAVDAVEDAIAAFVKNEVPEGSDGQIFRVARQFGLVAASGELAVEAGVLPFEKGECYAATVTMFNGWLKLRGTTGSHEIHEGVKAVFDMLTKYGSSKFENVYKVDGERTFERLGWFEDVVKGGKGVTPRTDYFIPMNNWDELCDYKDPKGVAKELQKQGFIVYHDTNRLDKQKTLPGVGKIRCRILSIPDEGKEAFMSNVEDFTKGLEQKNQL